MQSSGDAQALLLRVNRETSTDSSRASFPGCHGLHKSPLSCNISNCWKAVSLFKSKKLCCASKNHGMSLIFSTLPVPTLPFAGSILNEVLLGRIMWRMIKGGFGASPHKLFASRTLLCMWQVFF